MVVIRPSLFLQNKGGLYMANFTIDTFVIDRPLRGTMFDLTSDDMLWSVTQMEPDSTSLKFTTEKEEVVDAIGSNIMNIYRAKKGEFSSSNAIFSLGLYTAQLGTEKQYASSENKKKAPKFQTFTISEGQTDVTLEKVPVGVTGAEITQIYLLDKEGSGKAKTFKNGTSASETEFVIDAATKKITLPTGLAAGSQIFVKYDYMLDGSEGNGAVYIDGKFDEFPKSGKFILEVLGHPVCNENVKYFAYYIFDKATLNPDVEHNISSKGKHPFTLDIMKAYCDPNASIVKIVIPEG